MKVVIIEDEKAAAENLKFLLSEVDSSVKVDRVIDNITETISYFSNENNIELAFFDIHLADGISFDVFDKVHIKTPIIFTTAYDEYAIKAFRFNSVGYLLKPIDEDELREAVQKYKTSMRATPSPEQFREMFRMLKSERKSYKSTYLVQQRDTLTPLNVNDVAYFTIDLGIVKAITSQKREYIIEEKLEDIEEQLDPGKFFRANRQFIVHRKAIKNLRIYFHGKLILTVDPRPEQQIIVSKIKAPQLKDWIGETDADFF